MLYFLVVLVVDGLVVPSLYIRSLLHSAFGHSFNLVFFVFFDRLLSSQTAACDTVY